MKIVNGQTIPPYDLNKIRNAYMFMDRVQVKGIAEASAYLESMAILKAIIDGHYEVVEPNEEGGH
jgi:hypothetical protein